MKQAEIERLLRDHVRGVHEELETLMHGIEQALANHLERTEAAIAALTTINPNEGQK